MVMNNTSDARTWRSVAIVDGFTGTCNIMPNSQSSGVSRRQAQYSLQKFPAGLKVMPHTMLDMTLSTHCTIGQQCIAKGNLRIAIDDSGV